MAANVLASPAGLAALMAQPLAVVARMVETPSASTLAGLDLAGAIARADALGLPVRLPAATVAGTDSDRVVRVGGQGPGAAPGAEEYVLVTPARHLVTEYPAALPQDVAVTYPVAAVRASASARTEAMAPTSPERPDGLDVAATVAPEAFRPTTVVVDAPAAWTSPQTSDGDQQPPARRRYQERTAVRIARTELALLLNGHLETLQAGGLAGPDAAARVIEASAGSVPPLSRTRTREDQSSISDRGWEILRSAGVEALVARTSTPGSSISRLARWIATVEPSAAAAPMTTPDSLVAALAVFAVLHGRVANGPIPADLLLRPDPAGLAAAMGGTFAPMGDARLIYQAVRRVAGSSALIRVPGEPDRVFWLVAEDRDGVVVPRYVDPCVAGSMRRPAAAPGTASDAWGQALATPGAQVLLLDPAGQPTTHEALLAVPATRRGALESGSRARTVQALLGPAPTSRRPTGLLTTSRPGQPAQTFADGVPATARPHLTPAPPTRTPAAVAEVATPSTEPVGSEVGTVSDSVPAGPDPVWSLVEEADAETADRVRAVVARLPLLLNTPATPVDYEGWSAGFARAATDALTRLGLRVKEDDPLLRALAEQPATFLHSHRAFDLPVAGRPWWRRKKYRTVWVELVPTPVVGDQVSREQGNQMTQSRRDRVTSDQNRQSRQRGLWHATVPFELAGVPVSVSAGVFDARPTHSGGTSGTAVDYQVVYGDRESYLVAAGVTLRLRLDQPEATPVDEDLGPRWFRITKRFALMDLADQNAAPFPLDDGARALLSSNRFPLQVIGDGNAAQHAVDLLSDVPVVEPGSGTRQAVRDKWSPSELIRLLIGTRAPQTVASREWIGMPTAAAGLAARPRLTSMRLLGTPDGDARLRQQPTFFAESSGTTETTSGLRVRPAIGMRLPFTRVNVAPTTFMRASTASTVSSLTTNSRVGQEITVPTVLVETRYDMTLSRATYRSGLRFWVTRGKTPASRRVDVTALEEVPAGVYRAVTAATHIPAAGTVGLATEDGILAAGPEPITEEVTGRPEIAPADALAELVLTPTPQAVPDELTPTPQAVPDEPAPAHRSAAAPVALVETERPDAQMIARLRTMVERRETRHLQRYMWEGGRLRTGQATIFGAEMIADSVAAKVRQILALPENADFRAVLPNWNAPRTKKAVIQQVMDALVNDESLAVESGPSRLAAEFLSLTAGQVVIRLELPDTSRRLGLTLTIRADRVRPDDEPEYLGVRDENRTAPELDDGQLDKIVDEPAEQDAASQVVPDAPGPTPLSRSVLHRARKLPKTPVRRRQAMEVNTRVATAMSTSLGPDLDARVARVVHSGVRARYLTRRRTQMGSGSEEVWLDLGDNAQALFADELRFTVELHALDEATGVLRNLWRRSRDSTPDAKSLARGDLGTFQQWLAFTVSKDLTLGADQLHRTTESPLPTPAISDITLTPGDLAGQPANLHVEGDRVFDWDSVSYVHGSNELVLAIQRAVVEARRLMVEDGAYERGTRVGVVTPGSKSYLQLYRQVSPDRLTAILPSISRRAIRLHDLGEIIGSPTVHGAVFLQAVVDKARPGPLGVVNHGGEHSRAGVTSVSASRAKGGEFAVSAGLGFSGAVGTSSLGGQAARRLTMRRTRAKTVAFSAGVERVDAWDPGNGLTVPLVARVRFVVHAVLINPQAVGPSKRYEASRLVTDGTVHGLVMEDNARHSGVLDRPRTATASEPALQAPLLANRVFQPPFTLPAGPLPAPPRNLGAGRHADLPRLGATILRWLRGLRLPQFVEWGDGLRGIQDDEAGLANTAAVLDQTSVEFIAGHWGAAADGAISILLTYPGAVGRDHVQVLMQVLAADEDGPLTEPSVHRVVANQKNHEMDVFGSYTHSELSAVAHTRTDLYGFQPGGAGGRDGERTGTGDIGALGGTLATANRMKSVTDQHLTIVELVGPWAEVRQRVTIELRAYHAGKELGAPLRIGHDLKVEKFADHLYTVAATPQRPLPDPTIVALPRVPSQVELLSWQTGRLELVPGERASLTLPEQYQVVDFRGAALVQAAAARALHLAGAPGRVTRLGGSTAHQLVTALGQTALWGMTRRRIANPIEIPVEDPHIAGSRLTLTVYSRVGHARLAHVVPPYYRDVRRFRVTMDGVSAATSRMDSTAFAGAGAQQVGGVKEEAAEADTNNQGPAPRQTQSERVADAFGASDVRDPTAYRIGGEGASWSGGPAGSGAGAAHGGSSETVLSYGRPPGALIEWTEEIILVAKVPHAWGDSYAAVKVTLPESTQVLVDLLDAARHLGINDNVALMARLAQANSDALAVGQAFQEWQQVSRELELERLGPELERRRGTGQTGPEVVPEWPTEEEVADADNTAAATRSVRAQQEWHARKRQLDTTVSELAGMIPNMMPTVDVGTETAPVSPKVTPIGEAGSTVESDRPHGGDLSSPHAPWYSALRTLLFSAEAGTSPDRLAQWVDEVEVSAPASPAAVPPDLAVAWQDCLVRALGAFAALHGRATNTTVDDQFSMATDLRDLTRALGGELVPAAMVRPESLWQALTSTPNAMVLVHVRPADATHGHVYWLFADSRGGGPVPRVVDTQRPGLFEQVAQLDGDLAAQLAHPDTEFLVLDGVGQASSVDALLTADLTVPTTDTMGSESAPEQIPDAPAAQHPQDVVEAAAPAAPRWSMQLPRSVTRHGEVYVISANGGVNVSAALLTVLTRAATGERPMILLDTPQIGRPAPAPGLSILNNLLEQLAQRHLLPLVVTFASIDSVLDVVVKYGAAVLHPTLEKAGMVDAHLDYRWKATTARPDGRTITSDAIWPDISPAVLDAAVTLALPTDAVARVDDDLGELIWTADLRASRDIFHRLRGQWSAEQMATNLVHVERMIQRLPNEPALSVFAPVLDLGTSDHADIAFDYAAATEADRPATLLTSVGQLEAAGQFGTAVGGLSTARLTAMVTAVGGEPNAVSVTVSMLDMIKQIKSGEFETAKKFVEANRGKISPDQRAQWANAIAGLQIHMRDHVPHLKLLSDAVYDCDPEKSVAPAV
ncbi:hypothetical protein ACLQ24_14175 [Micromonospora sp. DT4]|uniref:hypothetical protein n=1 Tax=Micromonospora sp. DT4 TaxID=3393438 RepID=UPI003CF7B3EE